MSRQGYEDAARLIDEDWERMVAFYRYARAHWTHLRTTNVVESPLAALWLRINAAKRFQRVENATAVLGAMLLVAESSASGGSMRIPPFYCYSRRR